MVIIWCKVAQKNESLLQFVYVENMRKIYEHSNGVNNTR